MHVNMNVHHTMLAVGSKFKLLSLQLDKYAYQSTRWEYIKKKSMINDESITP